MFVLNAMPEPELRSRRPTMPTPDWLREAQIGLVCGQVDIDHVDEARRAPDRYMSAGTVDGVWWAWRRRRDRRWELASVSDELVETETPGAGPGVAE